MHMSGAKMVLVDYISRIPPPKAIKVFTYDENFVVATISKIGKSFKQIVKTKSLEIYKLNSILKIDQHDKILGKGGSQNFSTNKKNKTQITKELEPLYVQTTKQSS